MKKWNVIFIVLWILHGAFILTDMLTTLSECVRNAGYTLTFLSLTVQLCIRLIIIRKSKK